MLGFADQRAMMRSRLATLSLLALVGCRTGSPILAEMGPEQACRGQLVLEFVNRSPVAVQVGWIRLEGLAADPARAEPLWLGVVGAEPARYEVPAPGRVIFRTANPSAVREERHEVTHRVLCRES
jgi:hypothetical protein